MKSTPNFQLTRHFVRFVLPFSILRKGQSWASPRQFEKTFRDIRSRYQENPYWVPTSIREAQYILPYVEEFLYSNPEKSLPRRHTYVFTVQEDSWQQLISPPQMQVLLRQDQRWFLFPLKRLTPVLYLFRTGIGVVALDVELHQNRPVEIFSDNPEDPPRRESLNLDYLILFNRALRKLLFRDELKRELRTALLTVRKNGGQNIREISSQEYSINRQIQQRIENHLNTPVEKQAAETEVLPEEPRLAPLPVNALVEFCLKPIGQQDTDWEALYEYRMMGYSYVQLRREDDKGNPLEIPYDDFKEEFFWLRHFVSPRYLPTPEELTLEGNPNIYRSFQNIYFGFSLDGGAVVVWESESQFIREQFASRIRNEYFTLFLLALHQQMLAHRISKQIHEVNQLRNKQHGLRQLREQIFEFTVRCWFPQVSNNKAYNEVYNRWRKILEVEALYEEVKREIEELDDYLDRLRLNLESQLLNFITWFFFPFVFLVGFWGMNFQEIVTNPLSYQSREVLLTSGGIIGGYYIIFLLIWLWHKFRT